MREWPKQARRRVLRHQRIWPSQIEPQGSAPGAIARTAMLLLPIAVLAAAVGLAVLCEAVMRSWR